MGLLPASSSDLSKRRSGVSAAAQAIAQEDGMGDEGYGLAEEQAPAPYMPTLPEGMETSASTPQVTLAFGGRWCLHPACGNFFMTRYVGNASPSAARRDSLQLNVYCSRSSGRPKVTLN